MNDQRVSENQDLFSRRKTHIDFFSSTAFLAFSPITVTDGVFFWTYTLDTLVTYLFSLLLFLIVMCPGFYMAAKGRHEFLKKKIGERYLVDLEEQLKEQSVAYLFYSSWFFKIQKKYQKEGLIGPEDPIQEKLRQKELAEKSALRNAILKEEKRGE